ncbi:condensin subunit ScpA [Nitrosospira multiformis ATCC 25196]|uniref:Segregation and condensation protein A n=2 Tax=Nitrosospira multiformis (strain ATCC 25196 / NCIMB 11849 / C 71) TaxID=323848 RepID=Q2Y6L2_NITMU|nr:condensin subunit ScpA [Nitrosospira multiformis ATCC 25196]
MGNAAASTRAICHRRCSTYPRMNDFQSLSTEESPAPAGTNPAVNPIARIHGEPVTEIPSDLYIPPDALEVFLDTFQGPLDLLLYLIRKHNLDVLDIAMAELTRQYLAYIEMMRANKLELAAEYLLMAAVLIEIKSRMLLPKPVAKGNEDEVDPRAELVRRLLEYEQMKVAGQKLNKLPQAERDFALTNVWIEQKVIERLPEVNADDLRNAWLILMARLNVNRRHNITREELSVREHMTRILRHVQGHHFVEFSDLFNAAAGAAELVVTFLALLELVKERQVEVSQPSAFGMIYVRPISVLTTV